MGTDMVFTAKTNALLNNKKTNHMANFHKKDRAKVREGLKCRNPQRRAKGTGLTKGKSVKQTSWNGGKKV